MRVQDDPIRVGATIRALREAAGWSRLAFADQIEISRAHLSNIEDGRRDCTPQAARRIANLLGVPLAAITTSFTVEQITRGIELDFIEENGTPPNRQVSRGTVASENQTSHKGSRAFCHSIAGATGYHTAP